MLKKIILGSKDLDKNNIIFFLMYMNHHKINFYSYLETSLNSIYKVLIEK
jgi:rRNA-processing protein FCF1